jgi:hypothetical protein
MHFHVELDPLALSAAQSKTLIDALWHSGKRPARCVTVTGLPEATQVCCNICGVAMKDDDLITVCAACLQASCWQGIFMCQQSQSADVVQKTRAALKALGRENPCYWMTDEELAAR